MIYRISHFLPNTDIYENESNEICFHSWLNCDKNRIRIARLEKFFVRGKNFALARLALAAHKGNLAASALSFLERWLWGVVLTYSKQRAWGSTGLGRRALLPQ
eukprot:g82179.t1